MVLPVQNNATRAKVPEAAKEPERCCRTSGV